MYQDTLLSFDTANQHLTTGASTNIIDLSAIRQLGAGTPIYFVILVTTAFTDAGSNSTMGITLETDDNEAFSTATTAQTIGSFGAVSAIGTIMKALLQPDTINERYLRVKYTIDSNGDLTTGKFTAFLTSGIHSYQSFADNITIT